MDFKTRKIRKNRRSFSLKKLFKQKEASSKTPVTANPLKASQPRFKKKSKLGLIAAILLIVVLFFYGCSALVKQIGVFNIIGIFGESLTTDSYGNTNILLLGTGGTGHDGPDLTDTIILASIDSKNHLVPMLSIPRDFYVEIDELGGGMRINSVYEMAKDKYDSEMALDIVTEAIEEMTGAEIHYHIKIDFQGFKDIVESLDGVEINVEEAINDPYYPVDGTILYQTFTLSAGMQELDGETALMYARSRKTTSDFDRSKRQQKLLFAIKEKAMSKDVLLNPGKIKDLYGAVNTHLETNLSIGHIIELAKLSREFGQENIITRVVTDDPTRCGGFLYVPEREYFNGAFVLVPIGNDYDFIHQYVDLIFHYPEINKHPVQIQVLNGTKTVGIASESKAMLNRLCFEVIRFGNAQNQEIETTTIFQKTSNVTTADDATEAETMQEASEAAYFIKQLLGGNVSTEIPNIYLEPQYVSEANLIIELGKDYADSRPEDIFYQYYPSQTTSSDDDDEEISDETGEAAEPEATTE